MAHFIPLNTSQGKVLVNANHIVTIQEKGPQTEILLTTGERLVVNERVALPFSPMDDWLRKN